MKYILSVDQGTTGSRAMLIGEDGRVYARSYMEFKQHFPKPGWVEHDPLDIWKSVIETINCVVNQVKPDISDIAGVGITNQRETAVLWDKSTGKPVYNAIVWQCRRTSEMVDNLKRDGVEEEVKTRTGLPLDAYFSATKVRWILENVPEAKVLLDKGRLAFGTVDSWLVWMLTGGRKHITDVSNASRTLLFNINTLTWDQDLLRIFGIPAEILPECVDSSGISGYAEIEALGGEVPISGIAGDQQAATFGQGCLEVGEAKNTYGTGCFMLMNTGCRPVLSTKHLLTTVAWRINGKTNYALEGSVFIAGAAIQWLRDGLGIIGSAAETEEIALSVQDSGGVHFVPALTGLGAPYWDMHARGLITGLTRGTTKAHIVRAALEAIAYQVKDLADAISADAPKALAKLKVDGGASVNNFLMSFQADLLGVAVERPSELETTALGAAYLAGIGVGLWNPDEITHMLKMDKQYYPSISAEARSALLSGWQGAVKRTLTDN